jgi:uroporphyrinogen decarboxylase
MDRPPVALWRHFPVDDQSPATLAAATANFQRTYDFDLVKVTPSSSFCLRDWGIKDEWRGAPEGTREYVARVIREPEDWARLPVLDPGKGALAAQLESLRLLVEDLGPDIPIIQTIFNPLAQAKNLAGQETLLVHLRQYPDAVKAGLQIITESIQKFIAAAQETGIAGLFYAVQHAQRHLLTDQEYLEFGRVYDLPILGVAEKMWLNMLHLHGKNVMFDLFLEYPVGVINWHDLETPPSLAEAMRTFPGALCGGLRRWETMVLGTPAQVLVEAQEAIRATGGSRFILGTGCVTPTTAPHGNLLAARRAVDA